MISRDMAGALDAIIDGNPKFMAMLDTLYNKAGVATERVSDLLPVLGVTSLMWLVIGLFVLVMLIYLTYVLFFRMHKRVDKEGNISYTSYLKDPAISDERVAGILFFYNAAAVLGTLFSLTCIFKHLSDATIWLVSKDAWALQYLIKTLSGQ